MPVNAGPEYAAAEVEYQKAKTPQEKIKALERMYTLAPKHKSSEGLLMEIKTKISKLRQKIEKERAKKASGFSLSIKKEGAAQITLVGLPNSGKSTILNKLTGAKVEIASYQFTTKNPEIGVMDYNGIKIQLIEIPAIFKNFSESEKGPAYLAIARSSDLIIIVIDGTASCEQDLKLVEQEFNNCNIKLKKIKDKDPEAKKCLVVVNKVMNNFKCNYPVCWVDDLKQAAWNMLDLIYVQTKMPGKKPDFPPVSLKKNSTIQDLAEIVHKDFIKNFKYARIWGKSVKHPGSTVGSDHQLEEGDIIEIHTK